MSFIDTAAGTDEKFAEEAQQAMDLLSRDSLLVNRLCAFAGAVHIDKLQQVLVKQGFAVSGAGSKSIRINLANGQLFIQAVHDKYTQFWPMPWIIGCDRKGVVGFHQAPTRENIAAIIDTDTAIATRLYRPEGKTWPQHMVARLHTTYAAAFGMGATLKVFPSTGTGSTVNVLVDRAVSAAMITCLEYPWKHKHLVVGPTGVYIDPVRAALGTIVGEPEKVEERVRTLKDAIQEKKSKAKWRV